MYANQLVGNLAIRTAPVDRGPREEGYGTGVIVRSIDNSFTDSPILILAATESHIIFKHDPEYDRFSDHEKKHVLNYEYCDDKWTSWDDLMKLADDGHIELMKKLNE